MTLTVAMLAHLQLLGIDWLDPQYLLEHFGGFALWGAALVIFAECGLLVGFFLPGDSLLFTVGLLVAQGDIEHPLWWCCVVLTVAAIAGNVCGYLIGRQAGPRIFQREDSKIFKQKYVEQTTEFFDKYGNRAIVLARFVPIVRTFITVMAGVGRMGLRPLRDLLLDRRRRLGQRGHRARLLPRPDRPRPQPHRAHAARDRGDLGGADRCRVPACPSGREAHRQRRLDPRQLDSDRHR